VGADRGDVVCSFFFGGEEFAGGFLGFGDGGDSWRVGGVCARAFFGGHGLVLGGDGGGGSGDGGYAVIFSLRSHADRVHGPAELHVKYLNPLSARL
jgi:hypothetical protein